MPGIETLSVSPPVLVVLRAIEILRLQLLIAIYEGQKSDLLLCISEYQLDPATFDLGNIGVQRDLISLLGADDYIEFVATASQRESILRGILGEISSLLDNVYSQLRSTTPALLTQHPSPVSNHLSDSAQISLANGYGCKVRAVAERMRRILKKISERAILLDLGGKSVVAYWELSTGSNTAIESLPERLPVDQNIEPPAIPSSRETVLKIFPRVKVEKHDLEEGGQYRGE